MGSSSCFGKVLRVAAMVMMLKELRKQVLKKASTVVVVLVKVSIGFLTVVVVLVKVSIGLVMLAMCLILAEQNRFEVFQGKQLLKGIASTQAC